jgi:hypothetical protein
VLLSSHEKATYNCIALMAFASVSSIPKVRAILAAPIVVTDESADGEACYVLAAGNALWKRLSTASGISLDLNLARKALECGRLMPPSVQPRQGLKDNSCG